MKESMCRIGDPLCNYDRASGLPRSLDGGKEPSRQQK
jgi:hypothetical protein